jgi:hypothetical protein
MGVCASRGFTLGPVMLSACSEESSQDCSLPPSPLFAADPNVRTTGCFARDLFHLAVIKPRACIADRRAKNANGLLSEVA